MTGTIAYDRGVIVDDDGFFVGAVKWQRGTPGPTNGYLNGQRKAGSTQPRLRLVTDAEAIANPLPGGRWDAKAKEWQAPPKELWIVNVRRDDPRYGVLSGSRRVWPGRPLPSLPGWQAFVDVAPPARRPGRKPLFDFDVGEWVMPVSVVVFAEDGETCTNVVVKPRLEAGDVEPFEVEDESGDRMQIGPGMPRSGGHAPRYPRVSTSAMAAVLNRRNLTGAFEEFLTAEGFAMADFESLKSVSLNNRLLRKFVKAQGFTMKQAAKALQRAAEQEDQRRAEAIEARRRALEAEGDADDSDGNPEI
jgi:hypothetical protein